MASDKDFVCTRIVRLDEDGAPEEYDVVVYFAITSFRAGSPASWGDPGSGDEVEVDFVRAEHDPQDPSVAPLTEAEIEGLKEYLQGKGNDEVAQIAAQRHTERDADRADYEYERRRDDRMMGIA